MAGIALLSLAVAFPVAAQDEGGADAPQVLTSDLASRQEVEEESLKVTFVFVDDDQIVKVTIDGEEQPIEAADFLQVVKVFRFEKGRRTITVEVEDEKGNRRVKKYLVAFGVPLKAEKKADGKKPELTIKVIVDASYGTDSNPTLDISLPGAVAGLIPSDVELPDLQGAVPDADQPDSRTSLTAVVAASLHSLSGFAGIADTAYAKPDNSALATRALFLGGQYKLADPAASGLVVGLTMMDIDVGGNDHSLNNVFSLGWEFRSKDEDGSAKRVVAVELTTKDFSKATLTDGSQSALKYDSSSRDPENLDSFRQVTSVGTNTEGVADTDFSFFAYKANWANRWDVGLRLDIGMDFQFRQATESGLRTKLSFGVGWQFSKDFSAMLTYQNLTNLALTSPYEKTVTGLTVKGAF